MLLTEVEHDKYGKKTLGVLAELLEQNGVEVLHQIKGNKCCRDYDYITFIGNDTEGHRVAQIALNAGYEIGKLNKSWQYWSGNPLPSEGRMSLEVFTASTTV